MIGTMATATMSHVDRVALLQRYFPQEFVDAYCEYAIEYEYIPHDELLEALEKSPTLVLEESPYELYLLTLCGSTTCKVPSIVSKAARQIATFWKMRKQIFGPRAFYPFIMTPSTSSSVATSPDSDQDSVSDVGTDYKSTSNRKRKCEPVETIVIQGALNEEDVELLKTGFSVILPQSVDPSKSMSVSTHGPDEVMQTAFDNVESATRVAFYMLYLVSRNPVSQSHGAAGIVLYTSARFIPGCYYDSVFSIIKNALPIKQYDMYVLGLPSSISLLESSSMQDVSYLHSIGKNLWSIVSEHDLHQNTKMMFGASDDQVMEQLVDMTGYNRADLPPYLGGTGDWNQASFSSWQRKQLQHEQNLRLTEEQKRQNSKIVNLKKSRKHRNRVNTQIELLQRETELLKQDQERLKETNSRLIRLLDSARLQVLEEDKQRLEERNSILGQLLFSTQAELLRKESCVLGHSNKAVNEKFHCYSEQQSIVSIDINTKITASCMTDKSSTELREIPIKQASPNPYKKQKMITSSVGDISVEDVESLYIPLIHD